MSADGGDWTVTVGWAEQVEQAGWAEQRLRFLLDSVWEEIHSPGNAGHLADVWWHGRNPGTDGVQEPGSVPWPVPLIERPVHATTWSSC